MIENPPSVFSPALQWKKNYPAIISGIVSVLQFIFTFAIIGCEIGSILIDIVTATIYVGLWASLFFLIAAISLASSSCCCRFRGCATYTLVIQCIGIFFAICVLGFDAYFLAHPTTCFFPSSMCRSSAPIRGLFYTKQNFDNVKIPLIITQLVCGGILFLLFVFYVFIYAFTAVRFRQARVSANNAQIRANNPSSYLPIGVDGLVTAPPQVNIRPARHTSPLYHRPGTTSLETGQQLRPNDLQCPNCHSTMTVVVEKRPPQ